MTKISIFGIGKQRSGGIDLTLVYSRGLCTEKSRLNFSKIIKAQITWTVENCLKFGFKKYVTKNFTGGGVGGWTAIQLQPTPVVPPLKNQLPGGQCSSLVAHWLSFSGDHGSNPGGEKNSSFWVVISWLLFTSN